mmetsp:Transcript_8976/g.26965  ORF Transcript_8976/g.26965 Transcript_8976/m.26965 type:complete len:272 (+) Transcript_8976:257-1072(+)
MTSYVKSVLNMVSSALELNAATFSGAMDIIVFQDEDGNLQSTPFHVRFGKLRLLKSREKVVQIEVNGEPHPEIHMKLGSAGEAYFIEETDEQPPDELCPSPSSMPSSPKMIAYEQPSLNATRNSAQNESMGQIEDEKEDAGVYAVNYLSDSELDNYKRIGSMRRTALFVDSQTPEQVTVAEEEKADRSANTTQTQSSLAEPQSVEEAVADIVDFVVEQVCANIAQPRKTSVVKDTQDSLDGGWGSDKYGMEDLQLPPSLANVNQREAHAKR